jgi:hypothetical protein
MRSSQRLYSIQEVASLTYKSVGIIKTYAAKLGLGRKYSNRGRSFLYTQDDALRILTHITSMAKPTKKKVATKKVGERKPVVAKRLNSRKAT